MRKLFCFILVISISLLNINISFGFTNNNYSNNIIRIGFDPNLPPYQYYENGEYKGFHIDLIKKIAVDNQIEIEFIPMSLNECIQKFKDEEIDGILGIRYIYDLEENMELSDSLVQSTVSTIMLNEKVDKIKNILNVDYLIIAVERNSVEYEFVKNIKKANYNVAFNQESVIELLLNGRADMMIGVRHVAEYMLEKNKLSDKYTISNTYETPVEYYLGINKKYPGLLKIIDTELRDIKINGEYEEIYNRWINDKTLENQKRIQRFVIIFMIVAFLTIVGTMLINLELKRKINEKTKALSNTNRQLEEKIMEIRQNNELKNLIVESSPRGIVLFDNQGIITLMNECSYKICAVYESLVGKSIYDISPFNVMIEKNIDRVLNYGESYMGKEIEFSTEEKKCSFRYVIYPLYDYERKTRGGFLSIEDITDEKILKAQTEEKEKNRVLTQIISGIAHEIRNPLTSIKTYIELLPRKKDNEEFQKQITTVVPHEVERVNVLIEQLIDYAKPKPNNIEVVQVAELIESCILLFEPVVNKNNIELITNIDHNLFIKVDKNQIKQVIINLIINAIDAVCEFKECVTDYRMFKIHLNAYNLDNRVCISVEDNGIGMTREELKNVFELFYTTKDKGSGIGLPLSKQIIEENYGEIKIDSEKYIGSKVLITFNRDVRNYEKENTDY